MADWFGDGNTLDLLNDMSQADYEAALKRVPGLTEVVNEFHKDKDAATKLFFMEFVLHGLAGYSLISKHSLTAGLQFKDLLSGMFTMPKPGQDDDDEDDEEDNFRRRKY